MLTHGGISAKVAPVPSHNSDDRLVILQRVHRIARIHLRPVSAPVRF
jgi:hypothetical protein